MLEDRLKQMKVPYAGHYIRGDKEGGNYIKLNDEAVAQIKATFAEEGWYATEELISDIVEAQANPTMTGREWEKQAIENGWIPPAHLNITKEQVQEVAGEEVKLIPNHGGRYWVTPSGNVWSTAWGKVRPKRGQLNTRGYMLVHLRHGKFQTVHRLVAEAFIPNPDNLPVINHIDGDRLNNSVDNLEWCTQSYNMKHYYRDKPYKHSGSDNVNAKLTDNQVAEIRKRLLLGESVTGIAKELGVGRTTITNIKLGKSYKRASGLEDKHE